MIKPPTRGSSDTSPDDPAGALESGAESAGTMGSELGDAIACRLKALFDSVAAEPVPDRLRRLLEELERKAG